jgi:2-methylaconitate cis-trans-isomerase PrpF
MRWDVALAGGGSIELFCKVASLQEGLHAMKSAEFIRFVKALRPVPDQVLISMRVHGGRFGNAVDFLAAFRAAAWPVVSAALMDTSAIGLAATAVLPRGARVALIPGSSTAPTNASAAIVRNAWGWA